MPVHGAREFSIERRCPQARQRVRVGKLRWRGAEVEADPFEMFDECLCCDNEALWYVVINRKRAKCGRFTARLIGTQRRSLAQRDDVAHQGRCCATVVWRARR
jgi:hypothetical protein